MAEAKSYDARRGTPLTALGHAEAHALNYIQRLRQRIGHDLLLIPSVSAVIRRPDGTVLLLKHFETDSWVFPGGGLEPGERPADALLREIREETGLSIKIAALIGVYAGPEFEIHYKNQDQTAYMMAVYGCHVSQDIALVQGDEALDLRFYDVNSIARLNISPWMSVLLPDVLRWIAYSK